jgi:hypothetical protein
MHICMSHIICLSRSTSHACRSSAIRASRVRLLTHMTHLLSFFIKKKIKKNKKETLKTRVEGNLSLSLSLSRTQQTSTHQSTGGQRPTDPRPALSDPTNPADPHRSTGGQRLTDPALSLGPNKSSLPPPIDRRPTTDQPLPSSLSLSLSLSDPANPGARRSISANHAQAGKKKFNRKKDVPRGSRAGHQPDS